jgi:hypothetical protein
MPLLLECPGSSSRGQCSTGRSKVVKAPSGRTRHRAWGSASNPYLNCAVPGTSFPWRAMRAHWIWVMTARSDDRTLALCWPELRGEVVGVGARHFPQVGARAWRRARLAQTRMIFQLESERPQGESTGHPKFVKFDGSKGSGLPQRKSESCRSVRSPGRCPVTNP